MNFLTMEYFVTVAEKRSITKAAEELHITQQTLSAHIQAVERELGCKLIVRRNPLELTYEGEIFLRYAADFHRSYQAMQAEFCDITGNQRGVLRVGISYTSGRSIMPEIISAFQREYPNICIRLDENVNDALLRKLHGGEIDLAIANFDEPAQGIVLHDFYTERVVMLAPKSMCPPETGDELSAQELARFAGFPFVMGNPEDIVGRISRRMIKAAGFQPTVKAQSDNAETLLAMAADGIGICFCPQQMINMALSAQQLENVRIFTFSADDRYTINFGFRRRPYQWTAISEFMRIASETIGGRLWTEKNI